MQGKQLWSMRGSEKHDSFSDMKVCTACRRPKNKADFNKNRARHDGLQSRCRPCDQTYAKKLYRKDPESAQKYVERARSSRISARKRVMAFLLEHPCVDCGEGDPVVLDFDHIDPAEKTDSVSQLFRNGAYKKAFEEIEKCIVRCANCHRRRTAKQFNWWNRPAS